MNNLYNNEQDDHLIFECRMCDEPIEHDGYCSNTCRKADER